MPKPKLTLPPFAALRAFHAAATHDRYRDAAESLGLTESAISHQVKRLEERPGDAIQADYHKATESVRDRVLAKLADMRRRRACAR